MRPNMLFILLLLLPACGKMSRSSESGQFFSKLENSGSSDNKVNDNNSNQDSNVNQDKSFRSGRNINQVLDDLPRMRSSFNTLCQGPNRDDDFYRKMCSNLSAVPSSGLKFSSLRGLFSTLGLNSETNTACTTNSVSLVRNFNSVLNPRCIRFNSPQKTTNAMAVGFQRDDKTLIEVAAMNRSGEVNLYLIDYELQCEGTAAGCETKDFYLQSAESNWKSVSVYRELDLKNTVFDCLTCHQPGGANTKKRFLMAEAQFPWTHWIDKDTDCGKSLFADFEKAHKGESFYAGTSLANLKKSESVNLELFVKNNGFLGRTFGNNFFDGLRIEQDTSQTSGQPQSNVNESRSVVWQDEYDRRNAMLGLETFGGIGMPYRDCKQSDPNKLADLSNKMSVLINQPSMRPFVKLPHLYSLNLSSSEKLRERGLMAPANLAAPELLKRACIACHNSHLDQNVSRANFNAEDIYSNSLMVLGKSIKRLQMVEDDLELMPPIHYLKLDSKEKEKLIQYLNFVAHEVATRK